MRFFRLIAVPAALALAASARAADTAGTMPAAPASSVTSAVPTAGGLLQVLLGLVAVLALMAALAWFLRRFGVARGGADSVVKIVGGVAVGSRERVMVVEVGGQWIVVGVAAGRVSALATMPRQEGVPTPAAGAAGGNFSAWLKQTMDKRHGS
ncbi:MAG: flagellar biosynthetic protein FliO [Burkholderiaceae bacterium]